MAYSSYTGGRAENIADPSAGLNTYEYYNRLLLERAVEKFIVNNFVAKKTQPLYNGDQAVFSRYENLDTFKQPLLEGANPSGQQLSKVNVRTKLNTYGDFVALTDDLLVYGEDSANIKRDVISNLGDAAGQTLEELMFDTIVGGGTEIVFDTSLDSTLMTAELALRNALASKFTSMVTGSTKYATTPIRAAYAAFVTPEGAVMLEESLAGYTSVEKYGYTDGLLPNEVGSYRGIRFMESTLVPTWNDGGVDKQQAIILGEEAVAEVGIRGKKRIESIIHDFGSAGVEDPINRTMTIGVKTKWSGVVLRPDWAMVVHMEL